MKIWFVKLLFTARSDFGRRRRKLDSAVPVASAAPDCFRKPFVKVVAKLDAICSGDRPPLG